MAQRKRSPSVQLDVRSVLRWTAITVSVLWVLLAVYAEFFDVDPHLNSLRTSGAAACKHTSNGDFHRKYECTEAALDAEDRKGFVIWIGKVCFVLGPPLGLWFLLRLAYPAQSDNTGTGEYYTPPPPPIKRRRVR